MLHFAIQRGSEYLATIRVQHYVSSQKEEFSGPSMFSTCRENYNLVSYFKKKHMPEKVAIYGPIIQNTCCNNENKSILVKSPVLIILGGNYNWIKIRDVKIKTLGTLTAV